MPFPVVIPSDLFTASRREISLVTVFFTLLTLVLTYPQSAHLATHIGTHYDALFSIWRLAWIAHQLPIDPLHLYDTNIFHPQTGTLAYSDAMLLLGVAAAPAFWAGGEPVVIYNVLVLASFVACGVAMYVLALDLSRSRIAALFAGVVFAFQPYRFAHYPQIELLWSCWIPLGFWAFHRVVVTRRVADGVLVGVFVALQAWSCLYYSVFLVTALGVLALVLVPWIGRHALGQLVRPALAAGVVSALLVIPYALPYMARGGGVGPRTLRDIQDWSPHLVSYATAQAGNWFYPWPSSRVDAFEGVLFPGIVAVLLALAGLFARQRRTAVAYAVLLVLAADLSLGVNGYSYRVFFDWVWPYNGLRVPARMFVIVSAALAVLASMGMARVVGTGPRLRVAAGLGLLLAATAESIGVPIALQPIQAEAPRTYTWLRRQPQGVVFEWPIPRPESLGFTHEPEYMYFSTFHWKPLLNGYSGYYPTSYLQMLERLRHFPEGDTIGALRRAGVRYVILHSGPDPKRYTEVAGRLGGSSALQFEFVENLGHEEIAMYSLVPED